jgi:porin
VDKGIKLEGIYTGELFSILSGGLRRKSVYLDNVDLTLTLDTESLLGWQGASFFFYGLGNQGGNPSDHVGDAQVVSNIQTVDTWKLYEAWVQQNLFDNRLSLLAGLYDVSSEFDVIETAQLFLHSSFGTGPDFSQSGKNGPSIFPTTSLGLRVAIQPTHAFYLRAAVLDGVPGDPRDPHGTQIKLAAEDGFLVTTEIAYLADAGEPAEAMVSSERSRTGHLRIGRGQQVPYSGKYALGGWVYTTKLDDLGAVDRAGKPVQRRGTHGLYGLAEQMLFREKADHTQGLALFARLGVAATRVNQFGFYTGGGLVDTGLIAQRDEDQLGFGVAAAHNGGRVGRLRRRAGHPVERAEVAVELTYRAQITPWLTVQPDAQYVINPSTEPTIANAFGLALRFEVVF